jgi:hypothetical protein
MNSSLVKAYQNDVKKQQRRYVMRVENLDRYNKSFGDAPKELIKIMQKELLGKLRKKFGIFGVIKFFIMVLGERTKMKKKYADDYKRLKRTVPNPKLIDEFVLFASVFNALLKYHKSRDDAYENLKELLKGVWKESLMLMYQVEDLLKCEGDIFENYKKMNMGCFKSSSIEYNVKEIVDEENHLNIVVDKCLNVELADTFGVPELGKIGCDHDIIAFPPVEEKTNSVFRRPCNLAKDGKNCDFHFYRKGFEPEGSYEIH